MKQAGCQKPTNGILEWWSIGNDGIMAHYSMIPAFQYSSLGRKSKKPGRLPGFSNRYRRQLAGGVRWQRVRGRDLLADRFRGYIHDGVAIGEGGAARRTGHRVLQI